jgi:hypothetical protein
MVSGREWSRWAVKELSGGRLIDLYAYVLKNGIEKMSLSRPSAAGRIIHELREAGFDEKTIRATLERYGIKNATVRSRAEAIDAAAGFLGGYFKILEIGDEYHFTYPTKKSLIEYLMIEELARAGWTATQIWKATGFGRRRIQRIVKKVREGDDA